MCNIQTTLLCILFLQVAAMAMDVKSYSSLCDSAFCRIIDDSMKEITLIKASIDDGTCVAQLGPKADSICNTALERFTAEAPLPDDDKNKESIYDKKVEDLERSVDAHLHVLYLKQLSLLREKALKNFKASLAVEGANEYDALAEADEFFRREAEDSTRSSPDWDYAKEVSNLKLALGEIASRGRKIADVKASSAKQTQQAMQYLQMQQQQLQAIQQQVQGASSPWNIGLAYRIPDSNINLSGSYQQGRGNIQISCVPDESVPLLGANGFTHGVTPGNIGVSFNINL